MESVAPAAARFEPQGAEAVRSRLTVGAASALVRGVRLEALFRLGPGDPRPGWLVFATDDSPYEEMLSITLADPGLRVLDTAEIGTAYAAALWGGAQAAGSGQVDFRFGTPAAPEGWRLTVHAAPRLRLSLPLLLGGVRRASALRQLFTLAPLP